MCAERVRASRAANRNSLTPFLAWNKARGQGQTEEKKFWICPAFPAALWLVKEKRTKIPLAAVKVLFFKTTSPRQDEPSSAKQGTLQRRIRTRDTYSRSGSAPETRLLGLCA